ncbi:DUF5340 domain-containing protein [Phormidium sp. CCY1219]|uniref:DUF5340 domain-containing protein n=1 Tax=Phormidium sp. CCY1219 TaxID=2886104 RepID=UPI002D1F38E5|nr:DUF5340 domain-containing protein [Phormidium sp. CCY1219]MEB3826475.1 DUF5340 domain-containing protein [Phormidium sp. CCY1219]
MEPIPLPSPIHYELLLQMLERRTQYALDEHPAQREQVQQLIITLRKAQSQQRQLETHCQLDNLPVEHRWSLNEVSQPKFPSSWNAPSRGEDPGV